MMTSFLVKKYASLVYLKSFLRQPQPLWGQKTCFWPWVKKTENYEKRSKKGPLGAKTEFK